MGLTCPEKVQKWNFRPLKWPPFPEVKVAGAKNSQTRCPLSLAIYLPSFVGIANIAWEKSAKMWFCFRFKMDTILRNLEQLGRNFALHVGITQDMCLENIIGISVKLRALCLCPEQRFEHTFWIRRRRRLQTNQTYRCHTSCGTNNYNFQKQSY